MYHLLKNLTPVSVSGDFKSKNNQTKSRSAPNLTCCWYLFLVFFALPLLNPPESTSISGASAVQSSFSDVLLFSFSSLHHCICVFLKLVVMHHNDICVVFLFSVMIALLRRMPSNYNITIIQPTHFIQFFAGCFPQFNSSD